VNIPQIVAELKAQRDRLDRAIATVNGISTPRRRGRPPKTAQIAAKPKRRRLSAAGRKRISEAAKRRWAKRRRRAA